MARAFSRGLSTVPVIGERRYGALNSQRAEGNVARVEKLVVRCRVLEATNTTTVAYARLRLDLKRRGKPIPENDLWIAALCAFSMGFRSRRMTRISLLLKGCKRTPG